MNWKSVNEEPIPENKNVLAYNEAWINEDDNPDGVKIGVLYGNTFHTMDWDEEEDDNWSKFRYYCPMPTKWVLLSDVISQLEPKE